MAAPFDTSLSFDTSLIDQVWAERQQQREQQRQQVLQQVLAWLQAHGAAYGIETAFVFGSVTQPGRFHEGSDVDVGVAAIAPDRQIDAIADLSMALLRDVDIVDLRRCHFAHRIREQGVLWRQD